MDQNIIKGKWNDFKGEMQSLWGKITGDDLDRTEGNVHSIWGVLQEKYGELKDDARRSFDDLVNRYSAKGEGHVDEVKRGAADMTEDVKDSIKETARGDDLSSNVSDDLSANARRDRSGDLSGDLH